MKYLTQNEAKYKYYEQDKGILDHLIPLFRTKNTLFADSPLVVKLISPDKVEIRSEITEPDTEIEMIDNELKVRWDERPGVNYISTEINKNEGKEGMKEDWIKFTVYVNDTPRRKVRAFFPYFLDKNKIVVDPPYIINLISPEEVEIYPRNDDIQIEKVIDNEFNVPWEWKERGDGVNYISMKNNGIKFTVYPNRQSSSKIE